MGFIQLHDRADWREPGQVALDSAAPSGHG
jgi:hypothetical protein